jgi:phage/plasmid primase-like uncharacterized protein
MRDKVRQQARRSARPIALRPTEPRHDHANLAAAYRDAVNPDQLEQLARRLGLSVDSLTALGIGWSQYHCAWSFPMSDANGNVLGIRLRQPDGSKFAVKGGNDGLFIPSGERADSTLQVCEGPTDTAALLDMGFANVVGRPSCTGGIRLLADLVQGQQCPAVVIVADSDEPGRRGADNLASVLVLYSRSLRVVQPPAGIKDARDWLRAGAKREDLERAIEAAPVRCLTVRARGMMP